MFELIPQNLILDDIEGFLRDAANARWSEPEIYRAMNIALNRWREKVSIPVIYDLPSGFSESASTYTLPAYIQPPFHVQIGSDPVLDASAWTIEPGAGGWKLRMTLRPTAGAGRVIWNIRNGNVPLIIPVLSSGIDATVDTLTLNARLDAPASGYIKIEDECIMYRGRNVSGNTTTLENLTRGILSTPASHAGAVQVHWCIAMPRSDLRTVLIDETRWRLHEMYLISGKPTEKEFHQMMISYYKDSVESFWKTYSEQVQGGRMRLTNIVGID
jgi:hypothetical protein